MFELLNTIDRDRFEPSLLVLDGGGRYLSMLPPDVSIEVLGRKPGRGGRYPVLRTLQHIRQMKPDVVLATQNMTLTVGLMKALLPRKCRLVLRQANDVSADFAVLVKQSLFKHRIARQLSFATLRGADAVVCQSSSMMRDLRATLGVRAKLHVISNPIDVERVQANAALHTEHIPGTPSLISVGRLSAQKGYDILLDAIALIRPKHPSMRLTIVGDGPLRAQLEHRAETLGVTDVVRFIGFSDAPLPLVRDSDLFVLASRYEGFPNAALEALACGTPVVLTDCPGANSEIVHNGLNGRLASSVTSASFAEALEAAITELPAYDRLAIVEDCASRFAAKRIVGEYESLFETVSGRN